MTFVALDIETTSLDRTIAQPLEIAFVECGTSSDLSAEVIVPPHRRQIIAHADPEALAINRYFERRLFSKVTPGKTPEQVALHVADTLAGATIVGANPAYDAHVLWRWIQAVTDLEQPTWHFRMFDIEAAMMVHQGLQNIPSLSKCCDLFNIVNIAPHTAAGDAIATAEIFQRLTNHKVK